MEKEKELVDMFLQIEEKKRLGVLYRLLQTLKKEEETKDCAT